MAGRSAWFDSRDGLWLSVGQTRAKTRLVPSQSLLAAEERTLERQEHVRELNLQDSALATASVSCSAALFILGTSPYMLMKVVRGTVRLRSRRAEAASGWLASKAGNCGIRGALWTCPRRASAFDTGATGLFGQSFSHSGRSCFASNTSLPLTLKHTLIMRIASP